VGQLDAMGSTVLEFLRKFDRGIAPTMDDTVAALLAEHSEWSAADIRRCVSALEETGSVKSRWDGGAYVYWA